MNAQHTPGPLWAIIANARLPEPALHRAHIGLGEYRAVWTESDMRHFAHSAASPVAKQRDELLEALKHIEGVALADEWRDLPEIAKHAQAAIAKAEGGAP